MTFDEAMKLAAEIHATDGVQLVAVGRFVPMDQLATAEQWACSVAYVGGQAPTIVRSEVDWRGLIAAILKPKTNKTPAQSPTAIQHGSGEEQPLLF